MKKAKQLTCEISKPFDKLSKTQQRIILAKDVILQVKAKVANAVEGQYFDVDDYGDHDFAYEKNNEFREIVSDVKCEVCAKGALFLSHIVRTNKFSILQSLQQQGHDSIINRLAEIFTKNQLDLIETAFEKEVIEDKNRTLSYPDSRDKFADVILTDIAKAAVKFGKKYRSENNRLIAIMQNIIDNNGTFKP